jgi:ferrochelatase
MQRHALILLNMGGPQSLEQIPAYLAHIFNDPNIIDIPLPSFLRKPLIRRIVTKRVPKTTAIYQQIGGSSPLNAITAQQAIVLEQCLKKSYNVNVSVVSALRYTGPFLPQVWQQVNQQDFKRILLLSLYPHYSTTTTVSFIDQWQDLRKTGPPSLFIKSYFDHPAFIAASTEHIKAYIQTNSCEGEQSILLFSAHGIPVSRVKQGDPYPEEINGCIDAITDRLPRSVETYLGFQSKVGPVRWLKPETSDVIKILAEQGIKKLFVYPISFVSDNSESLYEIDILFREKAKSWGIDIFHTIPCLNTDDAFIDALAQIVVEAADGKLPERYLIS